MWKKVIKRLRPIHFYFISLLLQLVIFVIHRFYPFQLNDDPWFELFAKKLILQDGGPIIWSPDGDLITHSPLQIGKYYNWRPIGYSLFLSLIFFIKTNDYFLVRTIYQMLVYSFIPVMFYRVCKNYFSGNENSELKSKISVMIFIFNPLFLVGHLQSLDTWLKTLFVIIAFLLIFENGNRNIVYLIIVFTGIFLIAPIGFISIMLFLFFAKILKMISLKKFFIITITMTTIIFFYGLRNYYTFGRFDLSNSSFGYNLWLGNNERTLDFLKRHFGDGATIEDKILPHFKDRFKFLSNYSEYEKNDFFTKNALDFILKNPLVTIELIFWKAIGFWSPLRIRESHYTESPIKTIIAFIYQAPLVLNFFISFVLFVIRKEWRYNKPKLLIFSFAIFWFLPYLIFFTLSRYRTPIEFLLIILLVENAYKFYEKVKHFLAFSKNSV